MSELTNGNFWGILTDPRYEANLSAIVDFAEKQGGGAGFLVERHGESNRLEVAPVARPTDKEASDRRLGLIRESSWGNIGVFVTAHPYGSGVPHMSHLEEFDELRGPNPKPIRGWALPLPLGGSATLFVRESNTELFVPEKLAGLDDVSHFSEAATLLQEAGLNCYIRGGFQVPQQFTDDKKLFR